MECRYLAAYKVQGFSNTPDLPDIPLLELQDHKVKATLTGDTDRHCYVLDRQTALHRLLSLGQADDENLGERLNETIQEIRKIVAGDSTSKPAGLWSWTSVRR